MRSFAIAWLVIGSMAFAVAQAPVAKGTRAEDPKTIQGFESRLDDYVRLRDKQGGGTNKPTQSAADLKARQESLATKVKNARASAKHGDIFDDESTELFKRELRRNFRGPSGQRIRVSLQHAEPLPKLHLNVNDVYPEQVPLQSMPPTLLLNLPPLPNDIQYRLVGRDLILYDAETNLIVDYIHEAMPRY